MFHWVGNLLLVWNIVFLFWICLPVSLTKYYQMLLICSSAVFEDHLIRKVKKIAVASCSNILQIDDYSHRLLCSFVDLEDFKGRREKTTNVHFKS